jgi:hypothetical protein
MAAGWYFYHRLGYDRRRLELRPDGTIGEGRGGCEQKWAADETSITLSGSEGVICVCHRHPDGSYRGEWLKFEGMPIELSPVGDLSGRRLAPSRTRFSETLKTKSSGAIVAGLPCLMRYDLADRCIESLLRGSRRPDQIILVDNGGRFRNRFGSVVQVIDYGRNVGVAAAWNIIHREARGQDCVILNDDMIVGNRTIERISTCPGWFVTGLAFGCFMMREPMWREIGEFDEQFWPAYCEDTDYQMRMQLAIDDEASIFGPLPTDQLDDGYGRSPGGAIQLLGDDIDHHNHGSQSRVNWMEPLYAENVRRFKRKWQQVQTHAFNLRGEVFWGAPAPYVTPDSFRLIPTVP